MFWKFAHNLDGLRTDFWSAEATGRHGLLGKEGARQTEESLRLRKTAKAGRRQAFLGPELTRFWTLEEAQMLLLGSLNEMLLTQEQHLGEGVSGGAGV